MNIEWKWKRNDVRISYACFQALVLSITVVLRQHMELSSQRVLLFTLEIL